MLLHYRHNVATKGATMIQDNHLTDMIRIRIEPEKKEALNRLYKSKGTSLSRATREFYNRELEAVEDPLARFDSIMAEADAKREAYAGPEPTIKDIVAYIERVREARSSVSVA